MNNIEHGSLNEPNKRHDIFTEEDFAVDIYDKHIRQARNAIIAAAVVLAINLIVLAVSAPAEYDLLWIDMSIWGIFIAGFIALAIWTKYKPYSAIICALILYGIFIALNAFLDVSTLFKGIIMKVIIITFLIKGLKDAREAQEMKKITK